MCKLVSSLQFKKYCILKLISGGYVLKLVEWRAGWDLVGAWLSGELGGAWLGPG